MGSMTYWPAALITDMTGLSWGSHWAVHVMGTQALLGGQAPGMHL